MPRKEFSHHSLNVEGAEKVRHVKEILTDCLDNLESVCGTEGREMSLVRTKMEEAGFYAVKCVAMKTELQREL